jgi:hypothetical protein
VAGSLFLPLRQFQLLLQQILQAAALCTRFNGFKEDYMQPFNSLVCVTGERGLEFMKRVSMVSSMPLFFSFCPPPDLLAAGAAGHCDAAEFHVTGHPSAGG